MPAQSLAACAPSTSLARRFSLSWDVVVAPLNTTPARIAASSRTPLSRVAEWTCYGPRVPLEQGA